MDQAYILLIILACTLGLFIWGYWRYDIVAGIALMACLLIGAVPFHSAFSGFSNPAVITVACVMIISQAINQSGVIDYAVKRLTPVTTHAVLHIGTLTILAAILSAFMNNVGALSLLMPVAIQTAIKSKRSPSLVLLPIALGSALGGLITSIGTPPNLLISNFRQQVTGHPFEMFDFTRVGLVVAIIGVIYLIVVGWRLIPERRKSAGMTEDMFQIKDYITEIKVTETSTVVDSPISEIEHLIEGDVTIIGIIRNDRKRLVYTPNEKLRIGDILIVEAPHHDLEKLLRAGKLELVGEKLSQETLGSDDIAVMEAVVPQGSLLEGRSTRSIKLRSRYHINLLALAREGKPSHQRLNQVTLEAGDVLLLQGEAGILRDVIISLGMLPLAERGVSVGLKRRVILPLVIFIVAVIFATMQIVPIQIAFAGAVLALVVLNAMPIRRLYDSIDWPVVILLAAMIPVGGAMQLTGGTELIAKTCLALTGDLSPTYIIALLMLITMMLSDLMNNAATAVVMGPIAVSIAQALHLNVDPFLMAVAVAASCAFLTPIGHQNNILVMGPGGYKFSDYFRVGIFLDIIILIISPPLIVYMWPV